MLKKCSIPSSATIASASSISAGSSSVTKYIARPGAHRLARLRVAEHDLAPVRRCRRSSARGPFASSITSSSVRSSTDARISIASSSSIDTDPGRSRSSWSRAVDGRVEDAEAARARREDRLEADRALGVAELVRGGLDLAARRDAPEVRRRQPEPVQERVRLGLVVRAADRVRRRDEHRRCRRTGSIAPASPSRSNDDCGRTASAPSRSAIVAHRRGEAGVDDRPARGGTRRRGAGRPTARYMSVPTSRTSRSPFSRSAAQQRGRAGRAGGGDERR